MGSASLYAPLTNYAPLAAYKGADEPGDRLQQLESCRQDNVALGVNNW